MKRREVHARPVISSDTWGEGHWLVQLPSTPPRVVEVMVGPVGIAEKWSARGFDPVLQVHLGTDAPTYQDALYSVITSYLDCTSGHWPRVAWDKDPRVKVDPAEIVPLAPDVTETPRPGPAARPAG